MVLPSLIILILLIGKLTLVVRGLRRDSSVRRRSAACYGVGAHVYRVRMARPWALWVKLADFGTADGDALSLGAPVGAAQFTTLENAPIEQLILVRNATAQQCNI